MISTINRALDELAQACDRRLSVFEVRLIIIDGDQLTLGGHVLKAGQVDEIRRLFPDLKLDASSISILDRPDLPRRLVATNLTGLYEQPTFGMPLASELIYGTGLEVLEAKDRWVFTRQADGYLGWVYEPYLTSAVVPPETHLVLAPSLEIRSEPDANTQVLSRLMSGTGVTIEEIRGGWAHVTAHVAGWVSSSDLRAEKDFPDSVEERRRLLVEDSIRMIGVPYLWGGTSGNGIDCSGFVRLLHRWIGIVIPRDADLQSASAQPVEPPYEPGVLFFFGEGEGPRRITHVGMSLGGWRMIHSSRARNGVYVENLDENEALMKKLVNAGTFLN